jgi:hypothetical protein
MPSLNLTLIAYGDSEDVAKFTGPSLYSVRTLDGDGRKAVKCSGKKTTPSTCDLEKNVHALLPRLGIADCALDMNMNGDDWEVRYNCEGR